MQTLIVFCLGYTVDELLLFYCAEHVKFCRLDVPEVHNYFQKDRDLPVLRTGLTSLPSSEIVRIVLFEREYIEPWICKK